MRSIILLFLLGSFPMMAGEVGEEALNLLKGLRDPLERSKTVEKLGISRFCGPKKRELIKEHWEARAAWAGEGKYQFQLLEEKVDGDLGAVLLGATTKDNPDLADVISLVMVRGEGGWKVGPVEGRFENTGLGFDDEIRNRAKELELWLARERIGAASSLRLAELRKFQEAMAGVVSEEDLEGLGPKEVLERFLEAAETGNVYAMIIWQGYFERNEFPEVDWEKNLRVTRLGVAGNDRQKVWRLLTSKKVMKVVMDDEDQEDEGRSILVGFLSSFETGTMNDQVNPVRFEMRRTKSGWRVALPVFFSLADEDSRAFRNGRNRDFNWEDRTGVRRMFGVFESRQEKIREKEAQAVVDGLVRDLSEGDLETFLRRHYRFVEEKKEDQEGNEDEDDADDEELVPQARLQRFGRGGNGGDESDEKRMEIYQEAVKWWSETLKDDESLEVEMSGMFFEGETALAILSLPPSADSWKPVYQKLWLGKREEGWMILPGRDQPMMVSYPKNHKEDIAKLKGRYLKEEERIAGEFLKNVLKVVALDAGKGEAASEEEALKLVKEWRKIARNGGMLPLLKISAVRKQADDAKTLLRDVGYLRKGADAVGQSDQILGTKSAGRYRAVSLSAVMAGGNEMQCPLVIVVPVEGGYRVLVDIELPLETNRGITLLNEDRLDELTKELSREDLAAIIELRGWHQKTARPVWEKWSQEREAKQE